MNRESEELQETVAVIKSGTSAVHLCGDDYNRIDEFVTQLAFEMDFTDTVEEQVMGENGPETQNREKANVVEWNYGYGQIDFETRAKIGNPPNGDKIPFSQFLETFKNKRNAENKVILIRNARHVLEGEVNRENLAQLQQTIVHLKKILPAQAVLIYCDEKRFIPDELSSLVYFLDVKPPSQDELKEIIRNFINARKLELDPHLIEQLSSKCVGMSEDSFTQILKKAVLDKEKDFAQAVLPMADKTKKQFVDKSGLLKYVSTDVKIENVGGLDHLKWWLKQEEKAFKDPKGAKEMGITPAKGILLVGMPGCGKSLTSKAVANYFNYPMLQLDLGSLMGKYLGESEENLRRALKLAENSSPCVLWVDEIEKAFAGVGGDESGVSQRLFGYLLTWLNEKTAQVFVMATANDVAVLPPEFLRRGRFDEIFYVDFPSAPERKEIFKIHLGKAFGGKEKFEEILAGNENFKKQFDELTRDKKELGEKPGEDGKPIKVFEDEKTYQGTEGYAGSDIEALVNQANKRAWKQEKNRETEIFSILLSERKYMKPLKEVLAEKIARNKKKFGEYKLTSASETNLQSLETDSESTKEEDLLNTARNERCPGHILIKLSKQDFKKVKLAVLENPNCPPMCIVDLMEDNDPEVKAKAEEKQSATPEGIVKIAREGTKDQKLNLFKRYIPEEALEILSGDADSDVIMSVLEHKPLPEKVVKCLIDRALSDEALREKIKAQPNCPPDIKEKLERTRENCEYIKRSSRDNLICSKNNQICRGVCDRHALASEKSCKNCMHFKVERFNLGGSDFCAQLWGPVYGRKIVEEEAPNRCEVFRKKIAVAKKNLNCYDCALFSREYNHCNNGKTLQDKGTCSDFILL